MAWITPTSPNGIHWDLSPVADQGGKSGHALSSLAITFSSPFNKGRNMRYWETHFPLAECLDPPHDVALMLCVWIRHMMWPPSRVSGSAVGCRYYTVE